MYMYVWNKIFIYIHIASASLFDFICVLLCDFSKGKRQMHTIHASELARKVGCKVMFCRRGCYIWLYEVLTGDMFMYKCRWGCRKKFRHFQIPFFLSFTSSGFFPLDLESWPRLSERPTRDHRIAVENHPNLGMSWDVDPNSQTIQYVFWVCHG